MALNPQERREAFEKLSAMRQNMIEDERQKQFQREEEQTQTSARQREASLAQEEAKSERGTMQKGWRLEQHTKREEELEAKRKAEVEIERQRVKKEKEKVEDEKKTQKMRDLHDRAIRQKTAQRKLAAGHIEEESVERVDDRIERELRDLGHVLERTLEHLTQDRRRKIGVLEDETNRQRENLKEKYGSQKDPAFVSEHKRALLLLEGHLEEGKAMIENEYTRLKEEAAREAQEKEVRLRGVADRQRGEAKTRHENMEKWIDSHRGKA